MCTNATCRILSTLAMQVLPLLIVVICFIVCAAAVWRTRHTHADALSIALIIAVGLCGIGWNTIADQRTTITELRTTPDLSTRTIAACAARGMLTGQVAGHPVCVDTDGKPQPL